MRKKLCAILALVMAFAMTACASNDGALVAVERADMLTQASLAADRYAGVVVSENVTKISRDASKTIQEVYVSEGQEVKAGQKLFSYDSDALKLEKDKMELELTKLKNQKTTYNSQLTDLKKQLDKASDEMVKSQLTLQINTIETDLLEVDYQISAKQKEIDQLTATLTNVNVTSPVAGTVRKIDENDTDGVYITIQQTGAYRVKGTLNELSMMGGVGVGVTVRVLSRTDSRSWIGTVTEIDTENAQSGQNSGGYYYDGYVGYTSEMSTSSSYPFYVELESTEGLLLGQHVYIQVLGEDVSDGLWIPMGYLVNLTTDEMTSDLTASVWVANGNDELEQREVTLGEYNGTLGAYLVLSGLSAEDYVADPAADGCKAGAKVTYRQLSDFGSTLPAETDGGEPEEDGGSDASADGDLPREPELPEEPEIPEEPGLPEGSVLPENSWTGDAP